PPASVVNGWSSKQFTDALRHDQKNPAFNPSFRQLLHVSFKGGGEERRSLLRRAEETRGDHRQKRDGKSFRAAHETAPAWKISQGVLSARITIHAVMPAISLTSKGLLWCLAMLKI
ncbi:MAG: hypothetical protein WCS94_24625, partial [Verrucomicrobiota bacterium]